MQINRYKLENNILNSVSDCVSNKANTKKIRLKGAEVIFGERYGLVMHCSYCSSILYILEVTIARKVLPHSQGIKEGSMRNLLNFLSRFAKIRCKAG